MARQRHQKEIETANSNGYVDETQCLESLDNVFSSSALVSLGVLVEELTKECMISWEERNALDWSKEESYIRREFKAGPLSLLSQRNVQIEARLQLQGASFEQSKEGPSVTPDIVRNRLEVITH
jgi:DNA-nicking Smr family endonuclease